MRRAAVVLGMLCCAAGAAFGQDPASPDVYRQLMDNPRVRVLEATFNPGAKVPMRHSPEHLLYMLTDGTLVFRPEGKTAYEMTFTAGQAFWLPAQTSATENDSKQVIRALIVEMKQGTVASSGRSLRSSRRVTRRARRRR